MDIKDKVAIVTGGTGGIGFATVQALLSHGAKHVAIFDIEATKSRAATCIEKVDKEFGKGRAKFYVCDVTKTNEFAALYDEVTKTQNTVDILINNAGILGDVHVDLLIDINLKAVINCTLTAIERMGKHNNGKGGTILNLCSVAGLLPYAGFPVYTATKHGVYAFTKSLKEHYEHTGVRVLAICPGVTQTNFLDKNWREERLKFVQDKHLDAVLHCSETIQPAENVGAAIVKMIQQAEPGAAWVSEENQPPYPVADTPHFKDRKIPM